MNNQFDRRQTLAMGAASVAALSASTHAAKAATPNRGGTLRVGASGANTSDTFDGATHADFFTQLIGFGTVFDCLTEVAPDGSLRGELAESWEASEGADVWTFRLREAEFHNGKSFGADDMIESLMHHAGDDSKSAAKPLVSPITDMKKMDDRTVRITLAQGNADFPYLMSDYHVLMYPAGMKDEAIEKGIGTGAYMTENFDAGVRFLGKRNPNDYRDDRGYFDSVEYIAINDSGARINALVTGEVDVINKIEPKSVRLLERNRRIVMNEVTGNQHYTFPMHTNAAPFADNNVRMALKHAINRAEMVEKVLSGHGAVANDHPIGPANQFFNAELEQREYDPEKAKFFLKQAGLDSLDIDLSVADAAFPGAVDAGALFQETAKASGININLVREPNDGYWSNVWLKKPFCACYWSGRATEDWMFNTAYEAGVPWNDTFWEHEEFNKMLFAARVELDQAKRGEIYGEMQQIVRDEGGAIIPMYANYIDAASDKLVKPEAVSNVWQMDGCRIAERWWFA